jgi:nitrate reductase gamma subunit
VGLIVGGAGAIILALINSQALQDAGPVGSAEAKTIAIITGFAGIIMAVGGVMLAIRQIRTREHEAARKDLDRVEK